MTGQLQGQGLVDQPDAPRPGDGGLHRHGDRAGGAARCQVGERLNWDGGVPFVAFSTAPGAALYVAVFLSGIAIFGIFLFLTYYLQEVKGYSPVTSGLAFLPMVGCILLSSNVSSIVALPRLGPRALLVPGMLLGAAGMSYLTQLTVSSSYAGSVLPALLILGLGFGMIFAPAINTATAGVPRQDSGVASALVNTMQQVGGSIGSPR